VVAVLSCGFLIVRFGSCDVVWNSLWSRYGGGGDVPAAGADRRLRRSRALLRSHRVSVRAWSILRGPHRDARSTGPQPSLRPYIPTVRGVEERGPSDHGWRFSLARCALRDSEWVDGSAHFRTIHRSRSSAASRRTHTSRISSRRLTPTQLRRRHAPPQCPDFSLGAGVLRELRLSTWWCRSIIPRRPT